jgi:hypothetical protein
MIDEEKKSELVGSGELGFLSEEEFDKCLPPKKMTDPEAVQ